MDGRHADEYHGARVAPVAQLDRVLPSEGRGRGFESRLVHHLLSLVSQGIALLTETCPSPERRLALHLPRLNVARIATIRNRSPAVNKGQCEA